MADLWANDSVQFIRLLHEVHAVGLTNRQLRDMATSMDLTVSQVQSLFKRAEQAFERLITSPSDSPRETSPSPVVVQCSLCRMVVDVHAAHLHQGAWIGDACCWDERLRTSE